MTGALWRVDSESQARGEPALPRKDNEQMRRAPIQRPEGEKRRPSQSGCTIAVPADLCRLRWMRDGETTERERWRFWCGEGRGIGRAEEWCVSRPASKARTGAPAAQASHLLRKLGTGSAEAEPTSAG